MDRENLTVFERLQLRATCLQAGATLEAALVLATHGEPAEGTYTSYDRVVAWAGNLEDWLYESEELLELEDQRLTGESETETPEGAAADLRVRDLE